MLTLVEEELVFYIRLFQVHSIPSNKVDTLKTKLWIEFDGEVLPSSCCVCLLPLSFFCKGWS